MQAQRIDAAIERVNKLFPDDPQMQLNSLLTEAIHSAFLTPKDRAAFRREIRARQCPECHGCGIRTVGTPDGWVNLDCSTCGDSAPLERTRVPEEDR